MIPYSPEPYADHYGERDVTRPVVAVTLAEKVETVERFALDLDHVLEDWHIVTDPDLDGMVIRWNYLRVTVGELGDLNLAILIAREKATGRNRLRLDVDLARHALGWGRGEPRVRCVVCRTTDNVTRAHAPGSPACLDTQAERRLAHAG